MKNVAMTNSQKPSLAEGLPGREEAGWGLVMGLLGNSITAKLGDDLQRAILVFAG